LIANKPKPGIWNIFVQLNLVENLFIKEAEGRRLACDMINMIPDAGGKIEIGIGVGCYVRKKRLIDIIDYSIVTL